jgi:hypothetical protein
LDILAHENTRKMRTMAVPSSGIAKRGAESQVSGFAPANLVGVHIRGFKGSGIRPGSNIQVLSGIKYSVRGIVNCPRKLYEWTSRARNVTRLADLVGADSIGSVQSEWLRLGTAA